uniref:DNA topoisomerase n=1 Tax=viral metagenome TaxID=1070528 RepID=A0A6C0IGG8_9ZZZZ
MKYLVIVESPSKCKKIEKYLNDNDDLNIYEVVATMGHITELKSLENIDIKNNFTCKYELIEAKKKNTDAIKKKIKTVDEVIIACDADREGEGISYAICEFFKLSVTKTKRIIFNEITEQAILTAIKNPITINMNLVHAQQTRQILDLIVGFKVTPALWKFVSRNTEHSLSAGRCQTPALRVIYDNQNDINNSPGKQIYNTAGYFTNKNIPFILNKNYETEEEIVDFLEGATTFDHIYTCSQPTKSFRSQPEPFTTSKIQQTASNELHYSPKDTMKICQKLYEAGYITYMRTDSKKYSKEFIDSATSYIKHFYNENYINEKINDLCNNQKELREELKKEPQLENREEEKYKVKKATKKVAKESKVGEEKEVNQKIDAHEAIRPTDISLKELPEETDSKEKRLYKLIWSNTLESCMSKACYYMITASLSGYNNTKFSYTSEQIDFLGWKIIETKKQDDKEKESHYNYLQTLKQNTIMSYKKVISNVLLKDTKMHYTEAKLVNILEENGIGRPSTFSSIVEKIQEREYVKKQDVKGKEILCKDYELDENKEIFEIETKREFGNEKGKLVIQPLGIIVIEFLIKKFDELFNYDFTRQMEDDLDKISKGEKEWHEVCKICNEKIDTFIENLAYDKKIEIKIDDAHVYMIGKHGPVIKCLKDNSFKGIKKDLDIDMYKLENGGYKLEDLIVIEEKPSTTDKKHDGIVLGIYENESVILRKGKFGLYVTWGENSKTLKELGNRPIESIIFEEVEQILKNNEATGNNIVRKINENLSIRKSAKGDYIFFKTQKMKKPSFFNLTGINEDYKTCELDVLKSWIKDKYSVF